MFHRRVRATITIEHGSIIVYITLGSSAVYSILVSYGAFRQGISYFTNDVTAFFNKASNLVKRAIEAFKITSADIDIIEEGVELGPVATVDELVIRYKNGQIEESECIDEIMSVVEQIEPLKEKERLFPILIGYIHIVYSVTFPVGKLAKRFKVEFEKVKNEVQKESRRQARRNKRYYGKRNNPVIRPSSDIWRK